MLTYKIIEQLDETKFRLNIIRDGEVIATNCTFVTRSRETAESSVADMSQEDAIEAVMSGRISLHTTYGIDNIQEMVEQFVKDQGL